MNHGKWLSQAERDLAAAEVLHTEGHPEWACFLVGQAAEKVVKAYSYALGMDPPFRQGREGHDLVRLAKAWPASVRAVTLDLAQAQARLTQHAEDARYPREVATRGGEYLAPHEVYGESASAQAIQDARGVMVVCEKLAVEGRRFAETVGVVVARSSEPR